jgi:hypothetical protein
MIHFVAIGKKPGITNKVVKIEGDTKDTLVNDKHSYIWPFTDIPLEWNGNVLNFPKVDKETVFYLDESTSTWKELEAVSKDFVERKIVSP